MKPPTDRKEQVKILLSALALLVLILGAQGLVDWNERETEDRLSYRQWVADACTPNEGETAIARRENGKLTCTIYARYSRGMTPLIVSAAVMELPL